MRLIDADVIEKFIEDGLNNPDKQKAFGHDAIEILTEVHYAPTIEAEPVRHGRWIEGGLFNDLAKCSVCGAKNFTFGFVCENKFGYCPNCGARMDGGTE